MKYSFLFAVIESSNQNFCYQLCMYIDRQHHDTDVHVSAHGEDLNQQRCSCMLSKHKAALCCQCISFRQIAVSNFCFTFHVDMSYLQITCPK